MMNLVMHPEFPIPSLGKIKVVMNVMKNSVEEEAGGESGEETQYVRQLKIAAEQVPDRQEEASGEKPRHTN